MEQHEKLIKITPSCWHYRLIKYIWKIDPKMFMNLCPYFWLTIASIFVLPFVYVGNVISKFFSYLMYSFNRYMDKIVEKEIDDWLKTLNDAQIIEINRNGFESIDIDIPFTIKHKSSSWDIVEKWCVKNHISLTELYKRMDIYEEYKAKMRLKREELQRKKEEKQSKKIVINKVKTDKEKMNRIIKRTKEITGFLITLFLSVLFFFIVKALVWVCVAITEFIILNSSDCGYALLFFVGIGIFLFIIYAYCQRVSSIVDRIFDSKHATIKEWIIGLPALIFISVCYVIFYWMIYLLLWKWIIYAAYKSLRNAFFSFTGIFGEYFGASYSDYCPGIEWDDNNNED